MTSFSRHLLWRRLSALSAVLFSASFLFAAETKNSSPTPTPPASAPNRFEQAALAYEAADRDQPPPEGAILLAGDSQFYRWKTLREDLPGYTIINRGIDSLQFSDLLPLTDRLVLRYRPRLIVQIGR